MYVQTVLVSKYTSDIPRMSAGIIGILATWCFGLILGMVNAGVTMRYSSVRTMWYNAVKATFGVLLITIGFGLMGITIGALVIVHFPMEFRIPDWIMNKNNFLIAGTMHKFG